MNPIIKDIRITYNDIYIITEHIDGNILGKEYYCPFNSAVYTGKFILVCIESGLKEDKFAIDLFNSKCIKFELFNEVEFKFHDFPPEQIEYWISERGIFLRDNKDD